MAEGRVKLLGKITEVCEEVVKVVWEDVGEGFGEGFGEGYVLVFLKKYFFKKMYLGIAYSN